MRLGCSAEAAQAIVNEQGIDSLTELKALKDEDVVALCRVIRRPGGTIPNPSADQPDQPATIPATGYSISIRAEQNIKLAAYFIRHRVDRISRPVTIAYIQVENVRELREMKDAEAKYEKPETKPTLNDKNWPKTFEAIHDYLSRVRGDDGLPLAYLIRKDRGLPLPELDPTPDYANPIAEMIRRAPHYTTGDPVRVTSAFSANNLLLAEELTDIWRDHPGYTYGKAFLKKGEGRVGYYALYNHYLGVNSVNDQSSAAETAIRNLTYNGEGRRWTFEKYATTMKEQHGILDDLKTHGYAGRDETTKVRDLLGGIKTKDLESATSAILARSELQDDFDAAVSFIKSFINQNKSTRGPNVRTIAAIDKTAGTTNVEDRYYSAEEYKKLTVEQREELRQKRSKRGHKPGSKSSKVIGNPNKKTRYDRQIAALTASVSQLVEQNSAKKDIPDVVSTTDNSTDSSKQSNRTNPALRQK